MFEQDGLPLRADHAARRTCSTTRTCKATGGLAPMHLPDGTRGGDAAAAADDGPAAAAAADRSAGDSVQAPTSCCVNWATRTHRCRRCARRR